MNPRPDRRARPSTAGCKKLVQKKPRGGSGANGVRKGQIGGRPAFRTSPKDWHGQKAPVGPIPHPTRKQKSSPALIVRLMLAETVDPKQGDRGVERIPVPLVPASSLDYAGLPGECWIPVPLPPPLECLSLLIFPWFP